MIFTAPTESNILVYSSGSDSSKIKISCYKKVTVGQKDHDVKISKGSKGEVFSKISKDSDTKEDFLGNFTQADFMCLLLQGFFQT